MFSHRWKSKVHVGYFLPLLSLFLRICSIDQAAFTLTDTPFPLPLHVGSFATTAQFADHLISWDRLSQWNWHSPIWLDKSFCLHVLVHCPVAVKRHQDQSNSYKRNHFVGGLLMVSELVCYHGGEYGGTKGRHDAATIAESCISWFLGREKHTLDLAWAFETSKSSPVTYLFQQEHTTKPS
jgi:hypothetical protein